MRGSWTFAETCRLVVSSYLWMAAVTTPATGVAWYGITLLGAVRAGNGADAFAVLGNAVVLWVAIVVVVAGLVTMGGAVVALPFTHVAGLALQQSGSRAVHVTTHALLAGVLGALTATVIALVWAGAPTIDFPIAVSVAAGAAAAIARARQLRPERVPDQERSRADDPHRTGD
ncbi:hypothetical protein [Curtobacterium sp. 9128]|uniref:hypothetical protein n=1 Tax=Curtobacterium sp. 9128 TaxID=1793722 RepID=UPI0011A25704|nr:hypothetical protein [Curtobacterium sp. 9128]